MKRVPLIVAWMLGTTLLASAQTSFFYPHVVDGVLGAHDLENNDFSDEFVLRNCHRCDYVHARQ